MADILTLNADEKDIYKIVAAVRQLAERFQPSEDTAAGAVQSAALGAGVEVFLETPSSANLRAALTDETGTGAAVFGTSPTFTTSILCGSGLVINWNSGNMTLTHSANNLLFAASGKSILNLRQNPGGDFGGTYLDLWPGSTASGQNAEIDVLSSDTNAGLSFRMKGTGIFALHAPSDQSQSAGYALYENEANGSSRMVFLAAASIGSSFTLIWPDAVPAFDNTPLVCSTGGVLSFGSGMRLINSATATSGTTASITGIPACRMLMVAYKSISHDNGANQTLRFALSTNNGSSYGTAQNMFSTALAAGVSGSGILSIMRMDQTSNFVFHASFVGQILGGVETGSSGTVNAIQFSWSAGSFDDAAGAFYVYAI